MNDAFPSETAEEAAQWFVIIHRGELNPDEDAALQAWLGKDPVNEQALNAAFAGWEALKAAENKLVILNMRAQARMAISAEDAALTRIGDPVEDDD